MEKLFLILIIVAIIGGFLSSITDLILTHYQREYNKLLKEQNEILLKNLHLDFEIYQGMTRDITDEVKKSTDKDKEG